MSLRKSIVDGRWRAGLSGLLAAAAGIAVAELLASFGDPGSGPAVAVGGVLVDAAPTPVKEFAVRTFGTNDKPVLLTGVALGIAVIAVIVGVFAARRRWFGPAGAGLFALAGAAAAVSRPAAGLLAALPSLAGGVVTALALAALNGQKPSSANAKSSRGFRGRFAPAPGRELLAPCTPATVAPEPTAFDRRKFLRAAATVSAVAAAAGAGAVATRRVRGGAATRDREAVRLPAPANPAPPLPPGQDPGFVTANRDFYRVDTALTVPHVNLDTWRLRIHGRVEHPRTFTFAELLQRPLTERDITLNCVSNEVGGPYIGTARWLGVPLAPLLREAGIDPAADQVVARSVDGMSIGTPVRTVLETPDVMLCVGMNGEPLPLEHGFPVRMLTPGIYGYAGACKWLNSLELTTFDAFNAYWVARGWAPRGPVKTASRIDRPASFGHVPAGSAPVAGVAWAQGRGIAAVEVQVDDEAWRPAELLPVPSEDTWVQWRLTWAATPGPHTLRVRATDKTGAVQPEARVTPFPDGATGWHTVTVTVDG
ncbi:molybdopterin-dependent oxidoreductase [Dactylosporangium sp. NPDC051541]|uniref:molybdopterin-dependent oxidoreductase n=1 Tax=Dactylosporangium sp. NPDC051541 TaxID=3363977 RepID=UPI00378EB2C5